LCAFLLFLCVLVVRRAALRRGECGALALCCRTSVMLSSPLRPGGPTNGTRCDFVLQVCRAIEAVADRLVNKGVESLFADMGKAWDHLVGDPQLRWCVPPSFLPSHPSVFCSGCTRALSSHAHGCRWPHLGSVPRRASFTLLLAPSITPFGICTLGPAKSPSGNCSWT
jgi:hypothetical protein